MCLILLAHRVHPDYPLIVAANRDEFYARATASAHYWQKPQEVIAGRDLEAGGTWLGVSASGRFAAVTNFTEPPPMEVLRSRGELTLNFLLSDLNGADYAESLNGADYRGFNLLLWDGDTLHYGSNRHSGRTLAPGYYGLANVGLDEDKYRVTASRDSLIPLMEGANGKSAEALSDALLEVLANPEHPDRPDHDMALDPARLAPFIIGAEYGTRASTAVLLGNREVQVTERVFSNGGVEYGTARFQFSVRALEAS
ncbi:MAG: NRDE family protein [Pseudomonadota bacterium]